MPLDFPRARPLLQSCNLPKLFIEELGWEPARQKLTLHVNETNYAFSANRLMFVYFIQRKGFLDGDHDYLRHRLDRCKREQGKDKFYTFYRYFLLRLFHEGFGKRRKDRAPDLEKLLGNIPYLNGGLFDVHELEKPERYGKDIQIPDKAFERVFDYFDQYQWHLDERPLRADNEINPDLLMALWQAITSITILDPTGGSGAFIFAALNILEPLYEACLDRMEAFLAEWGGIGSPRPSDGVRGEGKPLHPNYTKILRRGLLVASAFPRRPESIFDGVEMPVTILISRSSSSRLHTTRVNRFYTEERPSALGTMGFAQHDVRLHGHRIAKIGSPVGVGIYRKIESQKGVLGALTSSASKDVLYYQEACRYWVKACVGMPFFRRNGEKMSPPHGRTLSFRDAASCAFAGCLVNSSLFYWFYSAFSDCEHINDALIRDFRIPSESSPADWIALEKRLAESQKHYARHKAILTKQGHKIEYDEMDAPQSKPILDEIDTLMAKHYGFMPEELDFILDYDIKYRLGRVAEGEED